MTTVSIILPTKNVENNIGDLLYNVYRQDFSGEIETIILDSSDDKTPDIVKGFPVEFIHVAEDDYNYGGTRNYGASLAKGNYLIFLSADVVIKDTQWLTKLLNPFKDPRVAGVFGRQHPKKDASPMEEFFIQYFYPKKNDIREMDAQGRVQLTNLMFFSNTNSAIRKDIWEKIKIPEMLMCEDQEWAKRVLLAGYKIAYTNESVVYHSHDYSLKQVFHRFFDTGATLPYVYRHEKIEYPRGKFVFEGLKYLKAECQYIVSQGNMKHLPYAMFYEFVRFLGYFLGSNHKYMPLWLKIRLCNKKNHWKKYDDIIVD